MLKERIDTTSSWISTTQNPSYGPVAGDVAVDAVIVGGGITGVTAAYLLKQAGRRVALIERRRLGWGETGRSTAHVTAVPDTSLRRLVDRLGPEHARAVWDAGFAAISRIRSNVRDERINCQFSWVSGYLHASPGLDLERARAQMGLEAETADALGIEAHYVDHVPGMGAPGVLFDHQARFHPLNYLGVLASRIHGDGSFVFEESEVTTFEEAPLSVRVGRHRIRAEYLVLATHLPMIRGSWLTTEIAERATYVARGVTSPGAMGEGIYWEDTEGAYEYMRVDRHDGYDEVILGGFDHDGPADAGGQRQQSLNARLAARAPGVTLTHAWSGRIIESHDGLPFIGEVGPRRFAATAYGGNGMTYGTLAGMMAADAALGRRNPWQPLFDIRRTNVSTGSWDFASRNRHYPFHGSRRVGVLGGSRRMPLTSAVGS
jgi:glycine/D-amino acid oxidase-like deaminating enzyme